MKTLSEKKYPFLDKEETRYAFFENDVKEKTKDLIERIMEIPPEYAQPLLRFLREHFGKELVE